MSLALLLPLPCGHSLHLRECPARPASTVRRHVAFAKPRALNYSQHAVQGQCSHAAQQLRRRHGRTQLPAAAIAEPATASVQGENHDGILFVEAVARVAEDTKCQDIRALYVAPLVSWTSYMVFITIFSKPQLQAAMARIEQMAQADFARVQLNQAGSSPWECMDFGDVIVHLFTAEQRLHYNVEALYKDAEVVVLPPPSPFPRPTSSKPPLAAHPGHVAPSSPAAAAAAEKTAPAAPAAAASAAAAPPAAVSATPASTAADDDFGHPAPVSSRWTIEFPSASAGNS